MKKKSPYRDPPQRLEINGPTFKERTIVRLASFFRSTAFPIALTWAFGDLGIFLAMCYKMQISFESAAIGLGVVNGFFLSFTWALWRGLETK